MNLTEELRSHIEQQATPVQMNEVLARAEAGTIAAPSNMSWLRPGLLIAVGAVVAIVVAVGLLPDDSETDVITEPTPTTTSVPAEPDGDEVGAPASVDADASEPINAPNEYRADGWQVTSGAIEQLPGLSHSFGRYSLYTAESTSLGMVVAGSEGVQEAGEDLSTATLWIERPDGSVRVDRLDLPFDATRDDVMVAGTAAVAVAERGDIVVVGGTSTTSTVLPSITNLTDEGWVTQLLPIEDTNVGLTNVIAVDDGFLAIGQSLPQWGSDPAGGSERTYVWHSADGFTWSERETNLGPNQLIAAVAATPTGIAGVGHVSGQAAAWFSTDGGVSWEAAAIEAQGTDYVRSTIFRVALGSDGLLALSSNATASQDASELGIWSSADGRTWTEVSPPAQDDGFRSNIDLTFDGQSFLIHEVLGGPQTTISLWRTTDGTNLEPVAVPAGPGAPWLSAVVDGSVRLVTAHQPAPAADAAPLQFWTYDG